jgi:D-lactate dehydrogenase (cytochrome)
LKYLESRSPSFNAVFRAGVVQLGGAVQRACARVAGESCPIELLRSPVPAGDAVTLRDVLPPCEAHQVLVLEPDGEAKATVFYFPGCGSERLHGSVGMAALHLALESGARVVLPPPFLCCGFPHHANAAAEQHDRIVLRDTIVFAQIREMFAHLKFNAVVVTCGTCREALGAMEAGKIFGAPVMDVARFVQERGLKIEGGGRFLYHAPCHDSLDGKAGAVLGALGGLQVERVPHCCGEAGTLSLSRPDIANAMLHRKAAALKEAVGLQHSGGVVLTNCPSCLQGLGRNAALGIRPRHIAVEIAEKRSGSDWQDKFRARAASATAFNY